LVGVSVGVLVGVFVGVSVGVSVGVFVGVSLATGPFTELDEARLRQPGAGVGTGAGEALPAFANAETTVAAATAAANRRATTTSRILARLIPLASSSPRDQPKSRHVVA
jgi:hypothetical protein